MASPYSLGVNTQLPPGVDPKMVQFGLDAIKKGLVSPQQALAAGKKFSPFQAEDPQVNANIAQQQQGQAQANQDQVMAQAGSSPQIKTPQLPALAPKAPKSGLTSKVEAKNTAQQKTTTNSTQALGQDVADMLDARATGSDPFKKLQAGQDDLSNMLQMEQQKKAPFDWGIFDRWSAALNGHPMPSPQVETQEERNQRLMNYAQKIQQDRKAIMDSYLSAIQKQKGGTVINLNGATQSASAENDAKDPLSGIRQMPEERKLIALNSHASKQLDGLQKERDAVQNGLSRLSGASSAEDMLAVDGLVRAAIGGRITNYDQQRQAAGDQSLSERFNQMIQKAAHGDLDVHNRAMYAQALESMGKDIESEIGGRLNQVRGFGDALDIRPDKIEKTLSPYGRPLPKAQGEAKKAMESEKAKKNPAATKSAAPGGLQSIDDYFNSKGGK